jgi:hypothetical protein
MGVYLDGHGQLKLQPTFNNMIVRCIFRVAFFQCVRSSGFTGGSWETGLGSWYGVLRTWYTIKERRI